MFWRVWHFWRGACSILEGHDILEEVLAVFWRWHFWRVLEVFRRVWHFWRALAVFWRALAVFWRVWHFWRGACSVLVGCGIFGGACSVLEGCGILRRCLQCFGGAL